MTTDTQFLRYKTSSGDSWCTPENSPPLAPYRKAYGTKISYRAWRIPRLALDEFIAQNSNVHPKTTIHVQKATDKLTTAPENQGDFVLPQNSNTNPGTGMRHYIRDIMGEDSNGQTNNG